MEEQVEGQEIGVAIRDETSKMYGSLEAAFMNKHLKPLSRFAFTKNDESHFWPRSAYERESVHRILDSFGRMKFGEHTYPCAILVSGPQDTSCLLACLVGRFMHTVIDDDELTPYEGHKVRIMPNRLGNADSLMREWNSNLP